MKPFRVEDIRFQCNSADTDERGVEWPGDCLKNVDSQRTARNHWFRSRVSIKLNFTSMFFDIFIWNKKQWVRARWNLGNKTTKALVSSINLSTQIASPNSHKYPRCFNWTGNWVSWIMDSTHFPSECTEPFRSRWQKSCKSPVSTASSDKTFDQYWLEAKFRR